MSQLVYRGGPVVTLDGKGRITVPARWRDDLIERVNGHLVVVKCDALCLSLYPLTEWERYEAELMALPDEHEDWRRILIGSATDVEIDTGSRVLIPPELRVWAGLEKDVKFMGVGRHFELWDQQRYDAKERRAIELGKPAALLRRSPGAPQPAAEPVARQVSE